MLKGLGNLAGFGSMLKQAQQIGARLQSVNDELKNRRTSGTAGGGMVEVEVNGTGEVLKCRIDPSLASDRELLEDLLPAAINQAMAKAKELHAEAMKSITAGIDMPGLDQLIERFGSSDASGPRPPEGA